MAKKKTKGEVMFEMRRELKFLMDDFVFVRDNMHKDNQDYMVSFVSNFSSCSVDHLSVLQTPFERILGNGVKDVDMVNNLKNLIEFLRKEYINEEKVEGKNKKFFSGINNAIRMVSKIKKEVDLFELE